jgi:hypothetical protein
MRRGYGQDGHARRIHLIETTGKETLMRIGLIIAGIIVGVLGIASLSGNLHFKQDKEVLRIGDLSAKTEETTSAPQWLGIAGIVIGGVLILGGALKKA